MTLKSSRRPNSEIWRLGEQRGFKATEQRMQWFAVLVTLCGVMMVGACSKKTAPAPPPPPPAPAGPMASISVSPTSIQAGQSASLTWDTTNATEATIDGIGAVEANGSQSISPTDSTTYHLVAKGAGGTQEATARLTVTEPPPSTPPSTTSISDEDLFNQSIKNVYFDYDKSDIRADQRASVEADRAFLTEHANFNFTIEGHCDERGSTEYNLALGDKRAQAAKNALTEAGVGASRIRTISYGKEKPFCTESDEACWQQNRRGYFVLEK